MIDDLKARVLAAAIEAGGAYELYAEAWAANPPAGRRRKMSPSVQAKCTEANMAESRLRELSRELYRALNAERAEPENAAGGAK